MHCCSYCWPQNLIPQPKLSLFSLVLSCDIFRILVFESVSKASLSSCADYSRVCSYCWPLEEVISTPGPYFLRTSLPVILLLCTAVPVTADLPAADRPTRQIRTSDRQSARRSACFVGFVCLMCRNSSLWPRALSSLMKRWLLHVYGTSGVAEVRAAPSLSSGPMF